MTEDSLTPSARRLRRQSTQAEQVLWTKLRSRRFHGVKFRRQVPLGAYIVDFVCRERKLIVELDGGQHSDQRGYDHRRTQELESLGFKVLRFWNRDVLLHVDSVLEAMWLELQESCWKNDYTRWTAKIWISLQADVCPSVYPLLKCRLGEGILNVSQDPH